MAEGSPGATTAALHWGDLTTVDLAAAAEAGHLVVQPIGAVEQHGAHLPLVTDALLASELAVAAVTRSSAPTVLLPTLHYGRSIEHVGFAGTVSMSTATFTAVCLDVARAVALSRFTKLVFINGHGGQPHLLEVVARDIRAESGLEVFVMTPLRFGLPDGCSIDDAAYGIHGGALETSLMLARAPHLVDMARARADGAIADTLFRPGSRLTLEGAMPTAWLTSDLSSSGVLGDPTGADVDLGERVFDHWCDGLADALVEAWRFSFPTLTGPPVGRSTHRP